MQSESNVTEVRPSSRGTKPPKPWLVLGFIILFIGGGWGTWRWLNPRGDAQTVTRQGPPPRAVELTTLKTGSAIRKVRLLGQSEPIEQSTLRTRTSGIVKDVLVEAGDQVNSGTPLVILDDVDQRLAVLEAEARVAQSRSVLARLEIGTRQEIIAQRRAEVAAAKAREAEAVDNLKRNQELVQQGVVSQRRIVEARAAVDTAKGDRLRAEATLAEAIAGPTPEEIAAQRALVATAEASLKQAKVSLSRTRVASSLTGIVQTRQVSPGDFVERNSPLLTIVADKGLDIFLELPEELSGSINPGLPIELSTRSLPQWQEKTTITAVVPVANASSRRQQVRVRLQNPPGQLLPGMAIEGTLVLPIAKESLLLSRNALTRRGDQWVVYAVESDKAKEIPVSLVADMGSTVAIEAPELQAGAAVISRGGDALAEGTPVKIVNQDTKPQG